MKRLYKRVFKSKKPSVGSIHGPGPASFASTSTGTTDPMPSLLACDTESDGTTSAQVTASVSVIQFRLRIYKYWLIVIKQTARNLGVSTSISALEISDLPSVSVPAAGVNLV